MKCDHEWHDAVEPDEWPTIESGWYLHCEHCGKWAIQKSKWVDDFEIPIDDPMVLTPKGLMEED